MHYGQDWRNHRREFHKLLNASALARYQPIFDDEIPLFLGKLQQRPEDFLDHMREYVKIPFTFPYRRYRVPSIHLHGPEPEGGTPFNVMIVS